MKPSHKETAARYADALTAAGWTRNHTGRFTTAWSKPDGARATTADIHAFLCTVEWGAFHLSHYTVQLMARHADATAP